jgi:hypothetical protein
LHACDDLLVDFLPAYFHAGNLPISPLRVQQKVIGHAQLK